MMVLKEQSHFDNTVESSAYVNRIEQCIPLQIVLRDRADSTISNNFTLRVFFQMSRTKEPLFVI